VKSLTPAEQNDLAVRAKAGDRKAVAALLAFCERDVLAIVSKWRCSEAEREDLAQVARMAILESAIPGFNPNKGYQFRFYAALWARTEVKRSKNTNSSVVVKNVRTSTTDVSMDAALGADGMDWGEMLPDEGPTPEDIAIADSNSDRVRHAMERIISSLREDADRKYDRIALCRDIVYNRLLSEKPVRLDALALRYGVARETIRKQEQLLLRRVRAVLVAA
jgi:RNA polymerase sigma factor (sigma-70 family)